MNRVAHGYEPFPPTPPPQRQPLPWADAAPRDPAEQWQLARRQELLNASGPIAMALLRAGDLQGTAGDGDEAWKRPTVDQAKLDAAAAERAVGIALALQAACDRARPRS